MWAFLFNFAWRGFDVGLDADDFMDGGILFELVTGFTHSRGADSGYYWCWYRKPLDGQP